jgi:hypothetical protein
VTDQASVNTCDHHYEHQIRGGEPLTVSVCQFCRMPDWADLREQVAGIRDAARQATGQPDTEQPVVAYRDPNNPRVLLCRQHGQSWHAITPATAEDLPDGGICTFGRLSSNECGRDVLATSTPAVGQPAAPADRAAETEARDTDVTWSVVFITDSGDAWQEWSKGWHRIEDALVSGENVAGIATVAEVRFVRTTTVRERFNLHQLAAGATP